MPLNSIDKVRRTTGAEYARSSRPAASGAQAADDKQRRDSVEISDAARRLSESGGADNLENVRNRVRSGFYARPEVTRQVAEKVAKDVEKKPDTDD